MKLFSADVIQYVKDTIEMYDAPDLGLYPVLQYLDGEPLEAAQQALNYDMNLDDMKKN